MEKIDKRKNLYLQLDTETAGTLEKPLVYDIGGIIHDKQGKIYHEFSFIIQDIFFDEPELMITAYYNKKIPLYDKGIENGEHKVISFLTAYKYIRELLETYNITAVLAHNMRFDLNALNNTLRYLTGGKMKYFFPYKTKLWCSYTMAKQTYAKQASYKSYCKENDYLTSNNQPRITVEILYRYLSGYKNFDEKHTALADAKNQVLITTSIFRQKKKMRKTHWIPKAATA